MRYRFTWRMRCAVWCEAASLLDAVAMMIANRGDMPVGAQLYLGVVAGCPVFVNGD